MLQIFPSTFQNNLTGVITCRREELLTEINLNKIGKRVETFLFSRGKNYSALLCFFSS